MPLTDELNPETLQAIHRRLEQIRPTVHRHREMILSAGSLFLGLILTSQAIKFVIMKHYRFNMLVKPVIAFGFYFGTEPLFMAYREISRHIGFESLEPSIESLSRFLKVIGIDMRVDNE